MAISNNSTGIRTGVCTSTTRPTAPYDGQVIYETDTKLMRVYAVSTSTWNFIAPQLKMLAGTSNSTSLVNIGDKYQLVYNNEHIDIDGEYNPSTSTFTCANTGVYLINIQTSARLGNSGDDYKVYIRKNSTDSQPFTQGASSGNAEIDMFIMHRLSLTAGDTVKIYAVNQGAYTNRIGNIYTENAWWKIERLS
jgi:hypothetical protein